MPPRIPTEADFAPLAATLPHALHFPNPRESTTAILILLHGLGDSETPFARFARNLALPGVLAVAVRGTAPLPPSLLLDDDADTAADGRGAAHFHWGDDVSLDQRTGDVDPDPGFERARGLIMERLVDGVLVGKCGWELSDVILFGFGQGGSLALGLASALRKTPAVVDVASGDSHQGRRPKAFKGAISIGGPLPASMVSTRSASEKSDTSVLVCQLGEDRVGAIKREFKDVRAVRWKRRDVAMPRDMDEVFPIMKFFADRLKSGW
ncbi:hypothetical protein TOPH_01752 [Tolypocladium ophioglossoides CBS 100239]|uniref:Phospholipase/carboxylesterase/thioesterase domain-containing protein n=1 Tax=Tolypocladium ophioglossoides (strain CBS 100239) TaxID=1163406 RepID=A0A0L0NIA4_TOLOC|nr:hypothetical protein TOPH_01752 [Tolypocladium ophioglossoides CBS 100239]